jgi:serine/threonine protein kinase
VTILLTELFIRTTSSTLHGSNSTTTSNTSSTLLNEPSFSFTELFDVHTSRYRDDFEEIRPLGRGGYGSVWHVRNKLDGCNYAIKKIRLKSTDHSLERVFREIKSMPRLDHPYVVRYYGSWLEHVEYPVRRSRNRKSGRKHTNNTFTSRRRAASAPSDTSQLRRSSHHLDGGLRIDMLLNNTTSSNSFLDVDFSDDDDDDDDMFDNLSDHSFDDDDTDDVVFRVSEDEHVSDDGKDDDDFDDAYHQDRDCLAAAAACHSPRRQDYKSGSTSARQTNDMSSDSDDDDEYTWNDLSEDEDSFGGIYFTSRPQPISTRNTSRSDTHLPPNRSRRLRSATEYGRSLPSGFRPSHRRYHSSGVSTSAPGSTTNFLRPHRQPPTERVLTLFIQMHLCHCTLQDYLRHRDDAICTQSSSRSNGDGNTSDPLDMVDTITNIQLFRRIVEGVAYIHSQGLMHRDLKPSNIFLESTDSNHAELAPDWLRKRAERQDIDSLVPKIGDFGLVAQMNTGSPVLGGNRSSTSSHRTAHLGYGPGSMFGRSAPVRFSEQMVSPSGMACSPRTGGVGTVTYAAPEQLAGEGSNYDAKVDIYALGVVFLEMCHPFATLMERATVLKQLRQGVLPEPFLRRRPKEAAFILWLTAENPALRPTAQQILEFDLMNPDSMVNAPRWSSHVERLRMENESLRQRILELEAQLRTCGVCSPKSTNAADSACCASTPCSIELDKVST